MHACEQPSITTPAGDGPLRAALAAAHGGAAVAVRDRARVTPRSCSFVGQQRPAGAGDGPGWLIDATLSSGAKAVSLEDCTLPAVRDGALRLS